MRSRRINVERICVESSKSFDEVLSGLQEGIGRPDMHLLGRQMADASTFAEYQRVIQGAVGSADLLEFLRLDLGAAVGKHPEAKAYKIVRIIAGNPLIMKRMVEHVPHAGSYAPVTLLVYEKDGKVHICYDRMESYLAPYENEAALRVARDLDSKVIKLMTDAAGG